MNRFAIALLLIAAANACVAAEKETVCAKYQTSSGWSKSYQVEATVLNGMELNQATSSFEYSGFATYVVIFWDKDQASIIEMTWPYLSPIGQEGKDRRGVKWEIAKSTICF